MPGLVPGIHVFRTLGRKDVDGRERRQVYVVCAKQTTMPGHDGNTNCCLSHDLPHRHPDRTDRDPDVVAAVGHDGCDRQNSSISVGRDDVRDRRRRRLRKLHLPPAGFCRAETAAAGVDRRRRRAVRLSRAVFSGAALCAAGRGRAFELSLAAVDRAVLVAAAGRAAGAASHHRRVARAGRHGACCSQATAAAALRRARSRAWRRPSSPPLYGRPIR